MSGDQVYLRHIIEAIEKIERYIAGVKFDDFFLSDMLIDAVVRELEIIGEAAGNISEACQKKNLQVPWVEIIGMRNRLIHEYFGVDKKIVWDTCLLDLKDLKSKIASIITA
jgi:uncharacterized protein with HEPN domain